MAKFLDVFLSGIAIFFLAFCWVYYLLQEVKTALWLALIVGLCGSYIVYKIVDATNHKQQQSKQQQKRLACFANYLGFCENATDVFTQLLKYYSFDVQQATVNGIVATKNSKKYLVCCAFDNDFVTTCEVRKMVRCAKRQQVDKLLVFCLGVKSTENQLANGEILTKFVDAQNAYNLFEQADKLPQLDKPVVKKSAYFLQFAFSKKRFGGYFASGIFLLITSAVTFFPLYTIVWGTALIGVALYSLLNKRYNIVQTVATLE